VFSKLSIHLASTFKTVSERWQHRGVKLETLLPAQQTCICDVADFQIFENVTTSIWRKLV